MEGRRTGEGSRGSGFGKHRRGRSNNEPPLSAFSVSPRASNSNGVIDDQKLSLVAEMHVVVSCWPFVFASYSLLNHRSR